MVGGVPAPEEINTLAAPTMVSTPDSQERVKSTVVGQKYFLEKVVREAESEGIKLAGRMRGKTDEDLIDIFNEIMKTKRSLDEEDEKMGLVYIAKIMRGIFRY